MRPRSLLQSLLVLLAAPILIALRLGDSGSDTVEWPIAEFPEPSGVVYHAARGTLFIVGDEGHIGEVSLDGKLLRMTHLGGDLEAITMDPRSGLLYVVRETHEIIFEIRPDDFKMLRRFTIDRSYEGDPNYLRRGGDGVEGLVFVPDEKHPEGGGLWIVNQFDPPVLVELAIPLRSSKSKYETARLARAIPLDGAPLSGVSWEPATGEFLVVSALWKRVSVLDADGRYERSVRIPGFMPEGLAKLPDGRLVIAQDSGGLLVWNPPADAFRGDVATGPPEPRPAGGEGNGPAAAAVQPALASDAPVSPQAAANRRR